LQRAITMKITTQYFITLLAAINLFLGPYATRTVRSAQTINSQIPLAATSTATPPSTPEKTAISTLTPYYIVATVWESNPAAPMLTYHKFKTNRPSTFNTVSRLDFVEELEKLYQSGYVTISLERWLAGDTRVPDGKRPIILSMDDAFFRNQITLTSEGSPAKNTGLGISWEFFQKHPDFGFHWALFANLGDKPYGEGNQAEQQIQLANVIVWCIEHDAMVYNHTFRHVNLKTTKGLGVTAELRSNDMRLRELLTLVNREDLIPRLQNMVALPGGRAPSLEDSETALYGYIDPNGGEVQAIFNIDYISRPAFLQAPYSKSFNPSNLPRMVANLEAIDYLVETKDQGQVAQSCRIGPLEESQSDDPNYLAEQILVVIQNGQCPQGIYITEQFVFSAGNKQVELIQKIESE